jgi:hypothetical protein
MKIYVRLFSMTVICIAIFFVFMAMRPTPAPAETYRLSNPSGRFHGYVSWPLYCGIAKCPDTWANAMNRRNKQIKKAQPR